MLAKPSYELPSPTNKDIFSIGWHRLLRKRLNALMRLMAVRGAADAPLVMSDDNALLPLKRGGSGTIAEITSADASVTITNPIGPVTDLSVVGSGGFKQYRYKSMQGDYIVGVPFDGVTEGASTNIAKPYTYRQSTTPRTVDSTTLTYSSFTLDPHRKPIGKQRDRSSDRSYHPSIFVERFDLRRNGRSYRGICVGRGADRDRS
jgi:hypothetical protein